VRDSKVSSATGFNAINCLKETGLEPWTILNLGVMAAADVRLHDGFLLTVGTTVIPWKRLNLSIPSNREFGGAHINGHESHDPVKTAQGSKPYRRVLR